MLEKEPRMPTADDIHIFKVEHPRLDAAAAPSFKQEVEAFASAQPKRVLLDLSAVEFVDSTGLGVLVSLLKKMGSDGRIAVFGAGPSVQRLFQITRLDSLFRLCASREEAESALAD
jgi:anti-sigma B factor antagonist